MNIDNVNKEIKKFGEKAFFNIAQKYKCSIFIAKIIAWITHNDAYYRYKVHKYLRKYISTKKIFLKFFYYRKYSFYSHKINVQLICQKIGKNFYFEHGDIVINGNCIIGDNVRLIGNNCIGGNEHGAPIIENNVDVGWCSCIIGNINICSNVIIGANSTITKNIYESGTYVCLNKKIK